MQPQIKPKSFSDGMLKFSLTKIQFTTKATKLFPANRKITHTHQGEAEQEDYTHPSR